MNARLYDPEIGRFIQADDFVEPDATQGLNRYSYVLNNPLSATDPSGNFSLRQALGVVVGVVAAIFTAGAGLTWTGFFIATGGGFASAAIATGSLKAGLWGAVSAAAFWGIGTAFQGLADVSKLGKANQLGQAVQSGLSSGQTLAKIAAHAGAGGTLSVLQGGKFGHGFVSAGFTEALSPAVGQIDGGGFGAILSRTAVSAAIGGTASKLSGGSFANGAQTGAFQQLFNDSAHGVIEKRRAANLSKTKQNLASLKAWTDREFPELSGYTDVEFNGRASSGFIAQFSWGEIVLGEQYAIGDEVFGGNFYDSQTYFHEVLHGLAMSYEGGFIGNILTDLATDIFVKNPPGTVFYGRAHQWVEATSQVMVNYYDHLPSSPQPRPNLSYQSYYAYRSRFYKDSQ